MAYIDQAYLEANYTAERVAQIFCVYASDGSTTGTVDTASLAAVILASCAEVDEVLIGVQDFPLATPPESVKEIAGVFAMYRGAVRRPEYQVDAKRAPYRQQYEDGRARLMEIRKGLRRIAEELPPKNVGGLLAEHLHSQVQPNIFLPTPGDDTSGFNGGGM